MVVRILLRHALQTFASVLEVERQRLFDAEQVVLDRTATPHGLDPAQRASKRESETTQDGNRHQRFDGTRL